MIKEKAQTTFCADQDLLRVGFNTLYDATDFVCEMAEKGLSPYNSETGGAEDMIIASAEYGFAIKCDWAEFGLVDWEGSPANRVPACRAAGTHSVEVAVPRGWKPSGQLPQVALSGLALA